MLKGLQKQGWVKSKAIPQPGEPTAWCQYFGPHGLRCAVGHCLPTSMEEELIGAVSNNDPIEELIANFSLPDLEPHVGFLSRMQAFHDDYMQSLNGKNLTALASENLQRVAERYDLEVPDFVKKDLAPK